MSRALDDDVKNAIKNEEPVKVFNAIADVLSQKAPELLEIEFLGRSHVVDGNSFVLQDGPAIAIPKLRLVQAFVFARKILLGHLSKGGKDNHEEIRRATAVMLLMDPEHLTAANTRKRLLVDAIKSGTEVQDKLENEKYLIDSFLTSRLHRHTKSPTLWNHRQWLMERLREHDMEIDILATMKTVTFVAADRHPRNYYSWLHARYLINTVDFENKAPEEREQLKQILESSKTWAFKHRNDISGWAFLMFFLARHPDQAVQVFTETLKLAASLHWRNEAVWYFLRNTLSQGLKDDAATVAEFQNTRLALLRDTKENTAERRVLDKALGWVETYSA